MSEAESLMRSDLAFASMWQLLKTARSVTWPEYFVQTRLLSLSNVDNWKVGAFYSDEGAFDYLDTFTAPCGRVIDPWGWPELIGVGGVIKMTPPERAVITRWRPDKDDEIVFLKRCLGQIKIMEKVISMEAYNVEGLIYDATR